MPDEPMVNQSYDVEDSLKHLKYWRGVMTAAEEHHIHEVGKANAWLGAKQKEYLEKTAYHESVCRAHLEASGKKTLSLINGTLKKRAGRDSIVILDEKQLEAWAREQGVMDTFFRTKVTVAPDKKAVMDYIKDGGELPLGIDISTAEDTYTVDTV